MEQEEILVYLRELLAETPSASLWDKLCGQIETTTESDLQKLAIDYVAAHTSLWPQALRVPLPSWCQAHLRGEETSFEGLGCRWEETCFWAGLQPGELRRVPGLSDAHVVWCPPGAFLMGSPDSDEEAHDNEKPQHKVSLSRGFWMWQTPVTQAHFEQLMGYNPSHFSGDRCLPVEQVRWHEAAAFCNALSRTQGLSEVYEERGSGEDIECELKADDASHEGRDYYRAQGWRLPTEAEWEYAARAGTSGSRYGKPDEIAWYRENSNNQTHRVGQKQPNGWGLYDMLGNVYEWAYDRDGTYSSATVSDPVGSSSGSFRVNRGGCWSYDAEVARAADRYGSSPGLHDSNLGFRLVKGGL